MLSRRLKAFVAVILGSAGSFACGVRQLAEHDLVGKLPTSADWQPALPREVGDGEDAIAQHATRALPDPPVVATFTIAHRDSSTSFHSAQGDSKRKSANYFD